MLRFRALALTFVVAFAFYALIASRNALHVFADVIHVSGTISANTVWTAGNVYVVDNHLTVASNASLIIQPGAVVKIAPNKLIGVRGVLKVQGVLGNPVTFTSLKDDTVGGDTNGDGNATAPAAADWGHIAFLDTSVDSESLIEYAIIRYGGYFKAYIGEYYGCNSCTFWGSVRFDSASPTVRNSLIEMSKAYALSASIDSFPVVSGNTLRNNEGNGLEIRGGTLATTTPLIKHWSNTDVVYVVTNHATIDSGVTLAIDPGVMVKIAPNKLIGVRGVLKVQGVLGNPVTFTSLKDDTVGGDTNGDGNATAPAAADWGHIAFLDTSVDSESLIEYAIIRYGGYFKAYIGEYYGCNSCTFWGSVRFDSASPTVRNSLIEMSKAYALSASIDSFPVVSGNTLRNNEGNGLEIRGGTLATTTPLIKHWSNTDVVYVVTNHATIDSGVTLAIDPGVMVKIAPNKLIGVRGVLKVQGVLGNPVTFTSLKDDTVGGDTNGDGNATAPAAADWGHIAFLDTSVDSESLIEYAIIRYGGYFKAYIGEYYGCNSCTFWGSVRFDSASPTVRNSLIEMSKAYALSASIDSFPVVSGNTLRNNEGNGLEIRGGTLATTTPLIKHWSNTDVVYVVTNHATIDSGVTLAIDPGVMVKIAPNKLIGVKGVLKVQGVLGNPVTFTSLKDDTVGGDTNGDGNATAPAAADWGHIAFLDTSVDSESLIEYAIIRYGGYFKAYIGEYYGCNSCTFWGSVRFDSASPTVRNTSIMLNKYGAWAKSAQPVLGCNNFVDNDSYGFFNETAALVVAATGQWWGDPSGPSHASNPTGLGDVVSNGVTFTPWRTSGCGMPPAAPSSVSAAGISETQILVAWADSAADESAYFVERSSAAAPTWTVIATLGANSMNYVDTGFACSSAVYSYRVRAYRQDDDTYSGYSGTASGATAPCAPQALQFTLTGPASGRLTWVDQSPDETEFRVERSRDGGASWEGINAVPANVTQEDVTQLACSQTYLFRVQAYRTQDAVGSGFSNVAAYRSPPCTPSNLTVTLASDGAVVVNWADSSSDEEAFLIERTLDGADWSQVGATGANSVTYSDRDVQCSTLYSYRVRSQRVSDGQVSAGYSNSAALKTRPCAPANLTVNAVSTSQVDLTWLDNSPDEASFVILAVPNTPGGQSANMTLAANSTTATMGQLACDTMYTFRVRAYRASDNVYSMDSAPVTGATLPCRKVFLPSMNR